MRSPARCIPISPSSRSASTRRARRSSSRTSGRRAARSPSVMRKTINKQMFTKKYADVFKGDAHWRKISVKGGLDLCVGQEVDLRAEPAVFRRHGPQSRRRSTDIVDARVLALLLDSITTDHISPAGSIKVNSPAGKYLVDHKVKPVDFNQYGTRRGNHEVMMRGTFANIRLKNQMVPGVEGGVTIHYPSQAAHDDLRRRHALQAGQGPAGDLRRQGIRLRLVARLGRQGRQPARRARRHLPVVRAHPPLEPDRHGRAAARASRKAPPGSRSA